MNFDLNDRATAVAAIEYFNAFHDGFVKELRLTSNDSFPERAVHATNGPPDLELVFAHYNYERDTRPADQLVRAMFRGVMGLETELTGLGTESPVQRVDIEEASRRRDDGSEEICLVTSVFAPRLEGDDWTQVEAIRFTFKHAHLEEL
jgi:hypothetical protein